MSDQKCWDAALIKTWRTDATLHDTMSLFTAMTNKLTKDCDPPLRRLPNTHLSFKHGVRLFVARYLPKINDRLLSQSPDKDVLLLKKLETSSYDTLNNPFKRDHEIEYAKKTVHQNEARIMVENDMYRNRNRSTDWNVVKGVRRVQRKRS